MKILTENLDEAKQVGDVYHFTSLPGLRGIGEDNRIKLSGAFISTTRDPNFSLVRRKKGNNPIIGGVDFAIMLDGDKLSEKYKSRPHDDRYNHFSQQYVNKHYGDEMEEKWYGSDSRQKNGIENIKSYIKKIIILPQLYDDIDEMIKYHDASSYYSLDDKVFGGIDINQKNEILHILDSKKPDAETREIIFELIIDEIKKLFPGIPIESKNKIGIKESKQSLKFNNWKVPDRDILKREFKIEHDMKGNKFWNSEKDFFDAVKNARVVSLTPQQDNKIEYRTHTKTFDQLHDLISSYASYPKYRNETTLKNLYNGFKNNSSMEMPIVIDFGNHKRVFSGNTRLDVAFQLGIEPEVLLIKAQNHD